MSPSKEDFKRHVSSWAARLDVGVNTITVRHMRRKWASCSTEGNLTFNAEILELDDDLVDYVIVHELLHLLVPNHGALWKTLMRAHLGDYEELHSRLRRDITVV
jgi:predicted metal-dependent hydrolase